MNKILYIFYIPFLILEWHVDMISKIWTSFHDSVKEMTLFLESKINDEPIITQPAKKG